MIFKYKSKISWLLLQDLNLWAVLNKNNNYPFTFSGPLKKQPKELIRKTATYSK